MRIIDNVEDENLIIREWELSTNGCIYWVELSRITIFAS